MIDYVYFNYSINVFQKQCNKMGEIMANMKSAHTSKEALIRTAQIRSTQTAQ